MRRSRLLVNIVSIAKKLDCDEPAHDGLRLAAVSVIMSERDAPSVLLIRRAVHAGDPWSGQIAFPGGKMQQGDPTARDTAVRETLEEVGIDLHRAGEFLGYGPLTTTHTGTMQVVPAVYLMKERADVRLNAEATSYRWAILEELWSPVGRATHRLAYGDEVVEMPAYSVGDYVVWGLTYRILNALFEGASGERSATSR